jgi:hypothetical protein
MTDAAMPLYTFYPETPAGSYSSFEAIELRSDEAACERASGVLREHPSARAVVIWCGERFIGMVKLCSSSPAEVRRCA